jgi:excisionase family DNA binding protein
MIAEKEQILTIDQTAELLQVSPRTIYDLISDKRKPGKIFGKKVGRSWRIKREEIDRFLTEESSSVDQMSLKSNSSVGEK